ncbi:MAG TPA: hypothetical protein VK524_09505 [Polyangiaceae bacterium]|nr:hypothetical protein [Polyangiaceae bacterium]
MLVECSYCGAPLDVRLHERVTKCKYCDSTTQVQQTRTVAQETPAGWQPPQQWTPPLQFPADSAKTLVYHAAKTVRRVVSLVFTLAILSVVLPAVIWAVSRQARSSNTDVTGALAAAEEAVSQAKQAAEGMNRAAAAPENLFAGRAALDVVGKFSQHLGGKPVRATQLVIYPEYAIIQAQDPAKPAHIDRYMYRNGVIGDPDPVNVQSVRGKLDDHLISLDEVALDKLPELVAATLRDLGYEEAKVSHVIVESNRPFSKHVVMRVYASGPRESGRIDYTGAGKVLRVYK